MLHNIVYVTEPCEHAKEALRREYLLKEYPVSAEDLFQILFDDKCGFTKAFQEGKGCYSKFGPWLLLGLMA